MNIDQIIAYEQGELDEDQIIEMFQEGINSGLVYQLQGSYGRMAQRLIEAGYCQPRQAAQAVGA